MINTEKVIANSAARLCGSALSKKLAELASPLKRILEPAKSRAKRRKIMPPAAKKMRSMRFGLMSLNPYAFTDELNSMST
jgi:hypothetical protein